VKGEVWDGVIVGASVHEGRHQRTVRDWIRAERALLERVPSAFFQVSLTSVVRDDAHTEEAMHCVERLTTETGWAPARVGLFAGALLYTQYGWLKRQLMRMISKQNGGDTDTSRDVEYTDWNDVARWTETFCTAIPARAAADVVRA
jgi:menaquinone-dependent protoporphyrinogen oxidase